MTLDDIMLIAFGIFTVSAFIYWIGVRDDDR